MQTMSVTSCATSVDTTKGAPLTGWRWEPIRRWRHLATTAAFIVIVVMAVHSSPLRAQATGSGQPTNVLTPAAFTGVGPSSSYLGDQETVNMLNGNVDIRIPLLKLPGTGGNDLDLELMIDSKRLVLGGGGPPTQDSSGTQYHVPGWVYVPDLYTDVTFAGGRLNVPELLSSYITVGGSPSNGGNVVCLGGLTVLDMDGSQHTFQNIANCQQGAGRVSQYEYPVDDTYDGSFMRLDSTNPNDIIAYRKDGYKYHFTGGSFNFVASSIEDPNGNSIQFSYTYNGQNATYSMVITDSVGRTITVSPTDIAYYDSTHTLQHISAAASVVAGDDVSLYDQGCQSSDGNSFPNNTTRDFGSNNTVYELSFPTGRKYSIIYNSIHEPIRIEYPSGGYTAYDYQSLLGEANVTASWMCIADVREVQYKRACRSATGTCATEEKTTYVPDLTDPNNSSALLSGNHLMDVTDPGNNRTRFEFFPADNFGVAYDGAALKEINRYYYQGQNTLVRTVHTDYTEDSSIPAYEIRGCSLPSTVTTTLNDTGQQFKTTYTYQPISLYSTYYASTLCGATGRYINNPLTTTDYDFDGVARRVTQQAWLAATTAAPHLLDRNTSTIISDPASGWQSSTTTDYDANGNAAFVRRGGTNTTTLTTQTEYDGNGNVIAIIDPLNKMTSFGYSNPYSDANCTVVGSGRPSSITDNLGHVDTLQYDSCMGLLYSEKDPNGFTTFYHYDAIGRRHITQYPDQSSATYTFINTAPNSEIDTLTTSGVLQSVVKTTVLDGVGRAEHTSMGADSSTMVTVDTETDWRGLPASNSNPYTGPIGGATASTNFLFDVLGRLSTQTNPDMSTVQWSYTGASATKADELRNQTSYLWDALGRLTQVFEPGASKSPSIETDYQYDAANNLTGVTQHGNSGDLPRSHTFSYDGLSRIITAASPESGTTCYGSMQSGNCQPGYDGDSNLLTRTDARNVVTTYMYDGINRPMSRTYSDGTPAVAFTYDTGATNAIGRLVSATVTTPTSTLDQRSISQYDALGRVTSERQCTLGTCQSSSPTVKYGYDLPGKVTSLGISNAGPSVTLSTNYDSLNRIISLTSSYSGSISNPATFDAQHPDKLFSAEASGAYGALGLVNPLYGILTSNGINGPSGFSGLITYDNRTRVTSATYTGSDVDIPATPSTALVTIQTPSGDADQSKQVTGTPTAGTGSVVVSGAEKSYQICQNGGISCRIVPDLGSVTLTVGAYAATANYDSGLTAQNVEDALTTSLNASGSPVIATESGTTINIVSNTTGQASNFALSWGGVNNEGGCSKGCHTTPDFTLAPSGGALSGGHDDTYTIYDAGTVSVAVNSATATVPFEEGSTAESIAEALVPVIQQAVGSTVTASASGNTVHLTSVATGPSSTFTVSLSETNNMANFPSASFSPALTSQIAGMPEQSGSGQLYAYNIVKSDGSTSGYDLDGNITDYTDTVMNRWNVGYDYLNRGVSATVTGGVYDGMTIAWSIDAFGNRLSQTSTGHIPPGPVVGAYTFNNSMNQPDQFLPPIQQMSLFDAAGNLGNDGTNGYYYDAENRLCAVHEFDGTWEGYIYDADGNRVAKGTLSSQLDPGQACNLSTNGFTPTSTYVLGPSGQQASELDGAGNWEHTNVFTSGIFLASYDSAGLHYALNDWLGTKRIQSSATGTIEETCSSLPFGDSLTCSGPGSDASGNLHFTGKERDSESGLDYFGARYYGSTMGRFMSPDPSGLNYADETNPQSLNAYAYVENNPLRNADPTGLDCIQPSGASTQSVTVTVSAGQCSASGPGSIYVPGKVDQDSFKYYGLSGDLTFSAKGDNGSDSAEVIALKAPPTAPQGRTNSPAQGQAPESTIVIPNPDGGTTTRRFGPDGRAVVDIDQGHGGPAHGGAPDPHAHDWDWGKKPPRQTPGRSLTPEEQASLKRGVATGAAAVATGYIIYRVIRFLPSLAPPLWPTIPANAIIP